MLLKVLILFCRLLLMVMMQRTTLRTCGLSLAFLMAAVDDRHTIILVVFLHYKFVIAIRLIICWQGRGGIVALTPYPFQEVMAGGRVYGCHDDIGLHELSILVSVGHSG